MNEEIFQRHELKFLVTDEQRSALEAAFADRMVPDPHGESTICNVYYDTPDYRLIRTSLEKPVYKEKLRLRSYGPAAPEKGVFLELKKKYKGIVYKRRVAMSERQAERWLSGESGPPEDGQMMREIQWFLRENRPRPQVLIACDRSSWRAKEDHELRITFDENIRWRQTALHPSAGSEGESLLPDGTVLMELKIPGAAPLWLAHLLSDEALFPTSFSKYGACYRNVLLEKYFNGVIVCV